MYGQLGCDDCKDNENLGILLPAVGGAISAISSVFGGKPKDTSGTQTFINGLLSRALNGDAAADHQIRCLAGDNKFATEFNAKTCGYAHSEDKAVAQKAVDVLNARTASPGAYTTSAGIGMPSTVAGLSTGPLLLAGVAGFALFTMMRGRR